MFYIMCQVSGGVTGFRQAPMKKDGVVQYFDKREDAEKLVKYYNEKMNHQYSVADFKYWVEEV